MTATIRAIETKYKGYRFRSRLEARWAVFFDKMGVAWEYEKEGYELDEGRYLPDFWLPECFYRETADRGVFVEIKGKSPTVKESQLCIGLYRETKSPVMLAIGLPPNCYVKRRDDQCDGRICEMMPNPDEHMTFMRCHKCHGVKVQFSLCDDYLYCHQCNCLLDEYALPVFESGNAARSARFEFGDTP